MRMKELVQASGLPRTAIHHYQREGLLPPARKTAANAATYGQEHVDRLKLIQALRGDEMGPFPLDRVRSILAHVESGVRPELAAALHGLPGDIRPTVAERAPAGRFSLSELARSAGISHGTARELVEAGLIIGSDEPHGSKPYDSVDVAVARVIGGLLEIDEIRLGDLEPIAELTAEATRYERALIGLATARLDEQDSRELSQSMYRSLHALNSYLYVRMTGWSSSDGG